MPTPLVIALLISGLNSIAMFVIVRMIYDPKITALEVDLEHLRSKYRTLALRGGSNATD